MRNITKYTINSMGFYFLFPIYFATALLFLFFHVPTSFYFGIFSLLAIMTIPVLVANKIVPLDLNLQDSYKITQEQKKFRLTILLFCGWVITAGFLDIYVNGFKLLDPSSYSVLPGIGRYVRHNSSLCWTLIPVTFIFLRSWVTKTIFIAYALIFPILIVDRNRLFISFYSLLLCFLLSFFSLESAKKKKVGIVLISSMILVCLAAFAVLGKFRSGNAFSVQSSGVLLIKNQYPLTSAFIHLPVLVKQIVIYITSPLFNFATVVAADFRNPELLLSQFSPFNRSHFNAYPSVSVLIPAFNVGTEFYPFVLYGGLGMVLGSFLLILITTLFFAYLFRKSPNIFTYIIFIKLTYCALFLGFGPQFYILYNLVVVMLMLGLWGLSEYLNHVFCELSKSDSIFKRKIKFISTFYSQNCN